MRQACLSGSPPYSQITQPLTRCRALDLRHAPRASRSSLRIGGSGQHGKLCTVFAQLTVNGKWEGPHVLAVRIRDDAGNLMPGVRIKDMGPKMGLNGVDNGQIWFDRVRVPRWAGPGLRVRACALWSCRVGPRVGASRARLRLYFAHTAASLFMTAS